MVASAATPRTPLVEIPTGFHIVRLLERTHAGQKPFDAKLQKAG